MKKSYSYDHGESISKSLGLGVEMDATIRRINDRFEQGLSHISKALEVAIEESETPEQLAMAAYTIGQMQARKQIMHKVLAGTTE